MHLATSYRFTLALVTRIQPGTGSKDGETILFAQNAETKNFGIFLSEGSMSVVTVICKQVLPQAQYFTKLEFHFKNGIG
jgi:hypothetical protein